jgi:hypothetical protein
MLSATPTDMHAACFKRLATASEKQPRSATPFAREGRKIIGKAEGGGRSPAAQEKAAPEEPGRPKRLPWLREEEPSFVQPE